MNEDIIVNHLISEYPKEGCGLLLENGGYFPCENTRHSGEEFRISPEQWVEAETISPVVAVIHSHPDWSATPSEADKAMCEASGVDWHIYSIRNGPEGPYMDQRATISPNGYVSPLIGRPFHHGVLDCLQIVLDYFRREHGVDLGVYEREDEWWNNGKDYYRELLPKAGFEKLGGLPSEIQLREGDIILMQIRSPVPNHAGIYLESGKLKSEPALHATPGSMLHHLYDQDSRREVYGGYWLKNTVSVWRYSWPSE